MKVKPVPPRSIEDLTDQELMEIVESGSPPPPEVEAREEEDVGSPEDGPLTDMQEAFCAAYVFCPNGAEAARRAGYSAHSARKQACRLLKKTNILSRIAELRVDLGAGNRIDRDTVMAKLETLYCQAMEAGDRRVALRAAEAQARLAGLLWRRPAAVDSAEPDPGAEAEPPVAKPPARRARKSALAAR